MAGESQVDASGNHANVKPMRSSREILGQVAHGVYVNPTRTTLTDYLENTWLPAAKATVKLSTHALYMTIVAAYVKPHDVAGLPVQRITGAHLNTLYVALESTVDATVTRELPKTIRNVHALLHRALRMPSSGFLFATRPMRPTLRQCEARRRGTGLPSRLACSGADADREAAPVWVRSR